MVSRSFFFLHVLIMLCSTVMVFSNLSNDFYEDVCPEALPTIKRVVEDAVRQERRMGASLLRLHFHDCFVNGCDASILLDQTATIDSEKTATANNNSIRGFEVIDNIKSEVDKVCEHPIVSCADIVAVAARDCVVVLGGPSWEVQLGRRDSTTANRNMANNDIPPPFLDLPALINNFKNQGLDEKDLVALSGGHTLGFAQCFTFRDRIYNETNNIDSTFASQRQVDSPRSGGDSNLAPLDPTPLLFDSEYFSNLLCKKGLLHSDQALFSGGQTDNLVQIYSTNLGTFAKDFVESIIKMGNIKSLTGDQGQIRVNCRKVN
ncbi:PREDICTED: cationic peroxidase 1-like [Nicotiana attenuata]|uniref:Peroxidase n=1 Tax=Nicotiana attenuata TaxID=49451 RepID=A0A314L9Y9_NICAT|nr:PREDICTED: cationic peroxidase 1-like [Nicotiana attenuata]OIT38591.1 peroxidase 4 [Nicotiana attenuata]